MLVIFDLTIIKHCQISPAWLLLCQIHLLYLNYTFISHERNCDTNT
jgi:hypothetical protein